MATFMDTAKPPTADATQAAQEAMRRYLDEASAVGRAYWHAWTATTHAGLLTAFDVQSAGAQATRSAWDSVAQANRTWLDQTTEQLRKAQDATAKLVAAGLALVGTGLSSNGHA